jgi:hypothetical protein
METTAVAQPVPFPTVTSPAADKPLIIRRGNLTITSTQRAPSVFTAVEQVMWETGGVQVTGHGENRHAALDDLESNVNKLKEILAVAR